MSRPKSRRKSGTSRTRSAMQGERKTAASGPPAIRRFKPNFRWAHVALEPYKLLGDRAGEFRGASRQVLAGKLGEAIGFHVRYFELKPGGFTSLERHRHSHVVIGARGRGTIRVGKARYAIGLFDTVYVGPEQIHQIAADRRSRFGFFCIVNARRDRPRPVTERRA
jgi:ribulose-bisphosphate carboxylase large chain